MPEPARRVTRHRSEAIPIRFRNAGVDQVLDVYREDRVACRVAELPDADRITYLVLDVGIEETQRNAFDPIALVWVKTWEPTGRLGIKMQRIDADTGEGLAEPTAKYLDQYEDLGATDKTLPAGGHVAQDGQVAWSGYTLVPCSPRRLPTPSDLGWTQPLSHVEKGAPRAT